MMSTVEDFRQYAEDCLRQADDETTVAEKNILLNLALAWVRLAQMATTVEPAGAMIEVTPEASGVTALN
jgi:hypothetical protein